MKRSPSIRTILFDWDGTLMDSAGSAFPTFRSVFRELGIELTLDRYEAIYSPNWYSMYEALEIGRQHWLRADELWLRYHAAHPVRLIENAGHTIRALRQRGYRLGLVTSGTGSRVKRELATLAMTGAFEVVVCNEDTRWKKPHPEGLEIAMTAMRQAPEACTYVGDTPEDVLMGQGAGVFTVAVKSGFPSSRRLVEFAPNLLLDTIVELLEHF
jgi:pyrophosphatase PpaX